MSFAGILGALASGGELAATGGHPEPLAGLEYGREVELKQQALAVFWRKSGLPGAPEGLVRAPQPRGYRTTSKRRAVFHKGKLRLDFPGSQGSPGNLAPSILDEPSHEAVYCTVLKCCGRPHMQALAASLNHVIVRGQGGALALILNVRVLDAAVVRGAKLLAEIFRADGSGVQAAFVYLDPTASDYYLEARRPAGQVAFKRLFGADFLQVDVGGYLLRCPVTAFSQVNSPMIPVLTAAVADLVGPLTGRTLLDLYCGYGLFSLTVGRGAARVIGIDHAGPAIEAARGNARHLGLGSRASFLPGRIDGGFLARRLRPPVNRERMVLDPPRQGTAPGVAAALGRRRPEGVVHLCCGTDEIPREVAAWNAAGLRLTRAVPLDLFPGTANLETLLCFDPVRGG